MSRAAVIQSFQKKLCNIFYQVDFVLYGYNDVQDYIDLGTD